MDAQTAAREAAKQLLDGSPSPGQCERAARLYEVAGDGPAAAGAWALAGKVLECQAEGARAGARDVEAVQLMADAAQMYANAGDGEGAARAAVAALARWPAFEEAKRIVLVPPLSRDGAPRDAPRLRRLPGSRLPSPEDTPAGASGEGAVPSMFQEAHARLLRLAGREQEAARAFEAALAEVEREVARRRREQQWQEALEAARSMLKLALAAGGGRRLDQARPEFVSLAREAAAEACTPEYFARGHDEVPGRAMEEALLEAHALGNDAFAARYEEEFVGVLERTAEVLDMLRGRRAAGEALLSAEHEWPMVSARAGARERLLAAGVAGGDLVSSMGLEGLAATHPFRAEVQEFAGRLEEVVARASVRAPGAYARAAVAAAGRNPARALPLAARAVELAGTGGRAVVEALRAKRLALQAAGRTDESQAAHRAVLAALSGRAAEEGLPADLLRGAEDADFSGGADPAARVAARAALARWHLDAAKEAMAAGDPARARARLEVASALGDGGASVWLRVLDLGPAERLSM